MKKFSKGMSLKLSLSIIVVVAFNQIVNAVQSPECLKNTFPMTSGGSRDEVANCMVYDQAN